MISYPENTPFAPHSGTRGKCKGSNVAYLNPFALEQITGNAGHQGQVLLGLRFCVDAPTTRVWYPQIIGNRSKRPVDSWWKEEQQQPGLRRQGNHTPSISNPFLVVVSYPRGVSVSGKKKPKVAVSTTNNPAFVLYYYSQLRHIAADESSSYYTASISGHSSSLRTHHRLYTLVNLCGRTMLSTAIRKRIVRVPQKRNTPLCFLSGKKRFNRSLSLGIPSWSAIKKKEEENNAKTSASHDMHPAFFEYFCLSECNLL